MNENNEEPVKMYPLKPIKMFGASICGLYLGVQGTVNAAVNLGVGIPVLLVAGTVNTVSLGTLVSDESADKAQVKFAGSLAKCGVDFVNAYSFCKYASTGRWTPLLPHSDVVREFEEKYAEKLSAKRRGGPS